MKTAIIALLFVFVQQNRQQPCPSGGWINDRCLPYCDEVFLESCVNDRIFVFHGAHARTVFYPEGGPNGGWRQEVTGVPEWLRGRLKYDHVWEVQMGGPQNWLWEPVRDGDVIEMDERQVVRVEHR